MPKVLHGENSKLFASPWKLSRVIFLVFRLFGIPITRTSNLFFKTVVGKLTCTNWPLLGFQICREFHISLEVKWIPRELNAEADAISKLTDYDDYTINEAIFQRIDLLWGPHTVDRFACYNSLQTIS